MHAIGRSFVINSALPLNYEAAKIIVCIFTSFTLAFMNGLVSVNVT